MAKLFVFFQSDVLMTFGSGGTYFTSVSFMVVNLKRETENELVF